MKKTIYFLTCLSLTFLIGCGNKDSKATIKDSVETSSTSIESSTLDKESTEDSSSIEESTSTSTEDPTVEPTNDPIEEPSVTKEPTVTEEPEITEEPTISVEPTKEETPTLEPTKVSTVIIEPTKEVTATPEPTKKPEYTFTKLDQVMYPTTNLNLRNAPNDTGAVVGQLLMNAEVKVTGKCNETGWYAVKYDGKEGYCHPDYLKSEKTVVPTQAPAKATEAPKPTTAPTVAPQVVDNDKDAKVMAFIKQDIENFCSLKYADENGWIDIFIRDYDFVNTREDAIRYYFVQMYEDRLQYITSINTASKWTWINYVTEDGNLRISDDSKFVVLWFARQGVGLNNKSSKTYQNTHNATTAYGVLFENVYDCWGLCDVVSKYMQVLGIHYNIYQGNNGTAAAHRWIEFEMEGVKLWLDPSLGMIDAGAYPYKVSGKTLISKG